MKQFNITIDVRSSYNNLKFIHHQSIEADNLVELYSKLLIANAQIHESLVEDDSMHKYIGEVDDIPF